LFHQNLSHQVDLGIPNQRLRWVLPAGGLLLCACASPARPPQFLPCPFRLITGLACPLCGMTRGLTFFLHGHWQQALGFHLFSPIVAALLTGWLVWDALAFARNQEPKSFRVPAWLLWGGLFSLVFYAALRWLDIIEQPPEMKWLQ
jgi:Protein of unknown function (DUF2752)